MRLSSLSLALTAIYGSGFARGPLWNIGKAKTGQYRVVAMGTSIANGANSTLQKFLQDIKIKYGDAAEYSQRAGSLGGSYENAYQGWVKQPYGGTSFVRARGESTSTAIRLTVYGDTIDVFYSTETDGGTFDVSVDGEVVGAVDCSGGQSYGNRARFSVARGPHAVTIGVPPSGYAYLEWVECFDSTRPGVMCRDYTYGGSMLANAVKLRNPTGAQVAGIPIDGDNGINAQCQPDADLAIVHWLVNDAGTNSGNSTPNWHTTDYAIALGKVVNGFRAKGADVILVVEMAGHYALSGSSNHAQYETLKSQMKALAGPGVWVVDWDSMNRMTDTVAYAAAYYTATNVNDAAGTFTGDFIHPTDAGYVAFDNALAALTGVPIPNASTFNKESARLARMLPPGMGTDVEVMVDGVTQVLSTTRATRLAYASGNHQGRQHPLFVVPGASNRASSIRELISASETADDNGKWIAANSRVVYFDTNTDYFLTICGSGNLSLRADSVDCRFYTIDGQALPITDTTYGRTLVYFNATAAGDEAVCLSVRVRATGSNYVVVTAGRLYDIALTKSDQPVVLG